MQNLKSNELHPIRLEPRFPEYIKSGKKRIYQYGTTVLGHIIIPGATPSFSHNRFDKKSGYKKNLPGFQLSSEN